MEFEWRDKDGNLHKIKEMELNYLINAMKFAKKKLEDFESGSLKGIPSAPQIVRPQ